MEEFAVRPLFDRIFVKKNDAKQTASGFHLPETVKGRAVIGTVVAVGEGMRKPDGGFIDPVVKVGDRVFLREFTGYVINWEDEQVHVFQENELIGVLRENADQEQ